MWIYIGISISISIYLEEHTSNINKSQWILNLMCVGGTFTFFIYSKLFEVLKLCIILNQQVYSFIQPMYILTSPFPSLSCQPHSLLQTLG